MVPATVKTATREPERTRLRREAELLHRARHPGVVAIESFADDDGRTCLTVASIEGTTLADAPPTQPADALRFVAALARTVADLHTIGMAHRSLRADLVLRADDGRPVLREFGDATAEADDADRRADAEALRDLIELIALAVLPASRSSRAARALRALAADLRARPEPATPADIASRAGRLATRHGRDAAPRARRSRHRIAATAVAPAVIVAAIVSMSRHAGEPPPAARTTSSAPSGTAPGSTPHATDGSPVVAPRRVEAGGAMFDVGQVGDDVLIADWHCDGEPSAALVRPSTGEVFVFASLPAVGETLTGRHVATVPGAIALEADMANAPCPPLVVRSADGSTHAIGDR